MDYKTAAVCYYQLKNKGNFALGAVHALIREVTNSTLIQEAERVCMLDALHDIAEHGGGADALRRLWKALAAHEQFQKAWRQLLSERGGKNERASGG
jgi:hypothetical protein